MTEPKAGAQLLQAQPPVVLVQSRLSFAARLDNFTLGLLQSVVSQKGANISDSGIRQAIKTATKALNILDEVEGGN